VNDQVVMVAPAPYVLLPLAAQLTGLTVKAIRHKIDRGQWLDGKEYRRGPDGHIYVSMRGFQSWVEQTG
jgi:hypothetical protein